MFRGLTQRARRILTFAARQEARRTNSDQLCAEHIVMALLKDTRSTAHAALSKLKIDPEEFYTLIEKSLKTRRPQKNAYDGDAPNSSTKILEDATKEAHQMGHEYIGTGHLLVVSLRSIGRDLRRWLLKREVTIEVLRDIVMKTQERKAHIPKYNGQPKTKHAGRHQALLVERRDSSSGQARDNTPVLDEFAKDLTKQALEKELDLVVGRTVELRRVVQVLARRKKNNPVLIGEPGVGKTAIVEGLAQLVVSTEAPEILLEKRILLIDLPGIVAGTKYRGEFEERMKKLMEEVLSDKNIILFVDELHTLIGAGGAEGAIDAANMFKPALVRGDLQCIGATTLNEYKKYVERDSALERRFQPIVIQEPSIDETVQILAGVQKNYEDYHSVQYEHSALAAAAEYSKRFIVDRQLPDKAIDILDEAGARKRIDYSAQPRGVAKLQRKIQALDVKKQSLINAQAYEEAASVRDATAQIRLQLEQHKTKWRESLHKKRLKVDGQDVLQVISDVTGVPLISLAQSEQKRMNQIEEYLSARVIGQHKAISTVSSAIRRARVGLGAPDQPIGSFVFLGPTGVGKTLLAKAIAEFLFNDTESLIRFDMSDYMERHAVSRLIGAPPGYVGYDEGGVLTEKIRRKPYSVVLLDEIEKAHVDVFNILLQIMEEGELQDNLGRKVSFKNTVLIMTSNLGTHNALSSQRMGFQVDAHDTPYKDISSSAHTELKRHFRPEFLNRVDSTIVFEPLGGPELNKIFNILIAETKQRLAVKNITLALNKRVCDYLVTQGTDATYGARPMRRTIQEYIEGPISHRLVEGSILSGDAVQATLRNQTIIFRTKNQDEKKNQGDKKSLSDKKSQNDKEQSAHLVSSSRAT